MSGSLDEFTSPPIINAAADAAVTAFGVTLPLRSSRLQV